MGSCLSTGNSGVADPQQKEPAISKTTVSGGISLHVPQQTTLKLNNHNAKTKNNDEKKKKKKKKLAQTITNRKHGNGSLTTTKKKKRKKKKSKLIGVKQKRSTSKQGKDEINPKIKKKKRIKKKMFNSIAETSTTVQTTEATEATERTTINNNSNSNKENEYWSEKVNEMWGWWNEIVDGSLSTTAGVFDDDPQSDDEYQRWLSRIKDDGWATPEDAPYHIPSCSTGSEEDYNHKVVDQHWMFKVKNHWAHLEHAPCTVRNSKTIVMAAAVQQNWRALQFASPELQNDKQVVMVAVKQNGMALEYASSELRNDQQVVTTAVKFDGRAIQYASPQFKNDKRVSSAAITPKLQNDVVTKAIVHRYWLSRVQKNGSDLQYAPEFIRKDKEVVLVAIQNDMQGLAIEYASPELKEDDEVKRIVYRRWSPRVEEHSSNLQFAPYCIRNDKKFVLAAIQNHGPKNLLQFASPELQNDTDVVMATIQQDGTALEYASPELQADKQVVLTAVNQHPNAIKYVHNDLKLDKDVLIAAGMFDKDIDHVDAIKRRSTDTSKIVLSTRFSLNETSQSEATNFTKLLKQHKYIQIGNFKVYAPNANYKKSCDPTFTDFDHVCRGTKDTCQYCNILTDDGRPTDDCCWRYSFRSQLQEVKDTGGFMLQLVETGERPGKVDDASLGKGQAIELDMANMMGTKVFQVYVPANKNGYEAVFEELHIDMITEEISLWYSKQCQDMSVTVIRQHMSVAIVSQL